MRNIILVIGLVIVLAVSGFAVTGLADGNNQPPSAGAISFAQNTSDLMKNMLVAALVNVIEGTTLDNYENGIQSIELIFSDSNTNMRLIGTFDPLEANNIPQDAFESTALEKALNGQPHEGVQRVRGKWFYRQSVPLSNFAPQCVICHPNYPGVPSDTYYVGALMIKVPIMRD